MLVQLVRVAGRQGQVAPRIVWLDLTTGQPTHEHSLLGFVHAQPRLGPIIRGLKDVFAFYSTGANDADLDFVRLATKGEAISVAPIITDAWTDDQIDPLLLSSFRNRLPKWRLGFGHTVHPGGVAASVHGKKDQLAFRLSRSTPLLFATTKPFGPTKQLTMKLGHNLAMQWKLEVMAGGRAVHEQVIDKTSHPGHWFSLNIPWAKFPEASQVTVRLSHMSGTESDVYVESLSFE
jgi:hypothetical protein